MKKVPVFKQQMQFLGLHAILTGERYRTAARAVAHRANPEKHDGL